MGLKPLQYNALINRQLKLTAIDNLTVINKKLLIFTFFGDADSPGQSQSNLVK